MIGKSGKHYNNPHVARAHGDAPEMGEQQHEAAMAGREGSKEKKGGDGKHHHHITKHEDGSYSSEHTGPDGQTEHEDHPSFEHALKHQADKFEEAHEPRQEDESERGNDREAEAGTQYGDGAGALESLYEND